MAGRDIGRLLAHAVIAMEEKLREKDEIKGSWKGISFQELVRLADKESIELKMSLHIYEHRLCDRVKALKDMRREAADNANFYAMIIEKIDDILENEK